MKGATRSVLVLTAALAAVAWFAWANPVHAAGTTVVRYDGTAVEETFPLPSALAAIRAWSVAVGDTDGDGESDTVLAGGPFERPIVAVLDRDGRLRRTFDVYSRAFTGGLNVAVGDLDGDGTDEILTAPAGRGGPDVRVYSERGELRFRFNAFDTGFRGGVRLAVGDVTGDGITDIVTAAGPGAGPQVRIFSSTGSFTGLQWFAANRAERSGVHVAVADFDGDGTAEIAAVSGAQPATVTVRDADGSERSTFAAFGGDLPGTARIGHYDVDADGVPEVLVTPESSRRILRALSLDGGIRAKLTPPPSSAGVVPAADAASSQLTVVPNRAAVTGRTDLPKYVLVDISDQKLRMFEQGVQVSERPVSTGTWSMPTPLGQYQVRNKLPVAYSRAYNLYMDWWMAFTPNGAYGLHSLPYWKVGGGRLYEGENHLGQRVSHGCIRQRLSDAKSLYDWADIGTVVIVQP